MNFHWRGQVSKFFSMLLEQTFLWQIFALIPAVTSDSCENQILLEPTNTGMTTPHWSSILPLRPPHFFKLSFSSPAFPIPWFHPRWVVSSLSPAQAASSQRLLGFLPAPLHPRPLPRSRTRRCPHQGSVSHLLGWLSQGQGGQGAPHLSPCTKCFPGLGISSPASHGIPGFPPKTRRWVTAVTLERSKAANPMLSLENSFVLKNKLKQIKTN